MTDLGLPIWFFVKIFYLLAFSVYVTFAGILVRQVYLMTQTIEFAIETLLRTFAWAHFMFAIALLLIALLAL